MKLLVIGIDGGTKKILEGMPMPFTQSLFASSKSRVLGEDLITRGWAQILTGDHAASNKSFYLMPCGDKSYRFSQAYSMNDMLSGNLSNPLWRRLNEAGASVGLMNIPTTGPVEKVNGFLVAGGGGGLAPSGTISPEMVYPPSCKAVLEDQDYIFDIRLPGGSNTVSTFFEKIRKAQEVQKNTFLELVKQKQPDFGFHCFRITTEVQYLARYEIEQCIRLLREAREQDVQFVPQSSVQEALINHYIHLDASIKQLFETLKPEKYLFVADHSTAVFEHEGNVDVWLEDAGYLTRMSSLEIWVSRLQNYPARQLRNFLLGMGLAKPWPAFRRPITRFSKNRTKAFGTFYDTGNFAGIYINDGDRFGGPVKTVEETNRLVDVICEEFNSTATARQFNLKAAPYRREFNGAPYQKLMPDIRIHKPDTIYFSGRHWQFIRPNPNLKPMQEDLTGIRYPHTGLKGSDPLFVYSPELEKYIADDDPSDLRTAYRMICRYFEELASKH